MNPKISVIFLAVFAVAMTRLIPHWPNVTAVAAIAIFGGATLKNSFSAVIIPLTAIFFSDLIINNSLITILITNYYNTIICMETLYAVINPFKAAENIYRIMNKNSILIFSDVFVHRIARVPTDYWRFSYDAHKQLFKKLKFDDIKTKIGLTRQNVLLDMTYPFPELSKYKKQHNESSIEFIIRKLFRRIFFHSMINLPRLLPEISIFSISTKVD